MKTALCIKSYRKLPHLVFGFLVVVDLVAVARGETVDTNSSVIEEVFVSAQRKTERMHDVPISMSAFNDKFLRDQGISDVQDIANYVPNVRFTGSGSTLVARVRGFGTLTLVTRGFEQPVGFAIDDVPYGRSDYFATGLFDVERIEILRGPQGHLFGANTTVGLVNLTSKDPSDDYSASVDLEIGELGRERFEVGIGGPIFEDVVNFRIALMGEERDGYVDNSTSNSMPEADEVFGHRKRDAGRFKLEFPSLLGANLRLSYQRDEMEFGGNPQEFTQVPQNTREFYRLYDPHADFDPENFTGSLDSPNLGTTEIETFITRMGIEIGDWELNALAGWSTLDSLVYLDGDQTPAPIMVLTIDEKSRQETFEWRVNSPDFTGLLGLNFDALSLGSSNFTAGLFYQVREQDPTQEIVDADGVLLIGQTAVSMFPFPSLGGLLSPPSTNRERVMTQFQQESKRYAAYTQLNWDVDEKSTIILGARYDETTKIANWDQSIEPETAVVLPTLFDEFVGESRKFESHFSPKIGLKVQWTESFNTYISRSTHFQAGGFNNFLVPEEESLRDFEATRVKGWEAGAKMRFFSGSAELNIGFFQMDMDDFQLFTNQPVDSGDNPATLAVLPVASVVNAGELRAQGIEMDFKWLLTEALSLRGSVGYNDTEFQDFKIGNCALDRSNTDGDEDPRCDHTGKSLPYTPKLEVSLNPTLRIRLGNIPIIERLSKFRIADHWVFISTLNVQYQDEIYLSDTLDERSLQDAYTLLNVNVGISDERRGWSFQVRAENLTDKLSSSSSFITAGGAVSEVRNPPRAIYAKFRWEL